jgi:hypothetical protein
MFELSANHWSKSENKMRSKKRCIEHRIVNESFLLVALQIRPIKSGSFHNIRLWFYVMHAWRYQFASLYTRELFSPAFVSPFCGIFQAPADEDVCRIRHVTLETIRSKAACLSCQLKQGVQCLSYSYN